MKRFARNEIYAAIVLLSINVAEGNPIPGPMPAHIYIFSERLEVAMSATEAKVKGTFVFSAPDIKNSDADLLQTFMQLPVWIPQQTSGDATVAAFWNAFHTNILNVIRPENREAFEKAIGLKVFSGKRALPVGAFIMVCRDSDQRPFQYFTTEQQRLYQVNPEPDLCCLVFRVDGLSESVQKHIPVEISYRQPLLKAEGTSHFYYLPIFENLPKEVSTTDTNRYSIILSATPGCSLIVTNNQNKFKITAGHSITIAPQNRQAIRATAVASVQK